jgi:hypothetical protein
VAFLSSLHQRVSRSLTELRRVARELGPVATGGASAEDLTAYTMDSEREAHLRAVGATPATATKPAPHPGPAPGNDLGDNVELF